MDSQSTTPVDPRVLETMIPYFTEKFGHPASRNHPFGWEAEGGVDVAREQIAKLWELYGTYFLGAAAAIVTIRARIAAAAREVGRDPAAVHLVAVSKTYGIRLRSDGENNQQIFSSLRSLNRHIQQFQAKP